jgi:hypothetical protein
MDNRAEVKRFLATRRARVTPREVGLPEGSNRRVPGLRRSEVAALAGVSVEYYTRIERGAIAGASPEVLDAITPRARWRGRPAAAIRRAGRRIGACSGSSTR